MPLTEKERRAAEDKLIIDVMQFFHDPLGYVRYAFPWGEGELADQDGPDEWQANFLSQLGDKLRAGSVLQPDDFVRYVGEAIQMAASSGHGIGKSALVAWLILWAISTMEDTRGVITANTQTQLVTKTWAELAKWHRLSINSHWFIYTATSIYSTKQDHERTWRVDAIPWSKSNPEAFAGLHNKGKRILVIFDEASAIEDIIWETAEGALTDEGTEIIWAVFSNPTRNVGRFRECWRRFKHRWLTWQIDSRNCKLTNKKNIEKKVADYGEESDYVKVRVRGIFPSAGDRQFIPSELVDAARGKHIPEKSYSFAPKIISCDPSWTGSDELVIYFRQGLYSRKLMTVAKNDNDIEIAGFIARFEDELLADAVFIDLGYGTGIFSAGKTLGRDWVLVSFSAKSSKPGYVNKRAEMWGDTKDWLKAGGVLEDDQVICDDLIGPEVIPRPDGKILLESKDDMKDRGLPSPNRADALALTFAYPVEKKKRGAGSDRGEFVRRDYEPYEKQTYNPFDR